MSGCTLCPRMCGVDRTVQTGYCGSGSLAKVARGVLYDVESYKKTLEMVKAMKAKVFVPSHAEPCEDISELAQYNIDKVLEIEKKILELCAKPISFENLLQKLFDTYHLKMSFEQHVLIGSTVRSYLSYMKDKGELAVFFDNNMMIWHKTEEK